MTTPDLEAGLSSYPPALLVGSASPNRMRARVPAEGDAAGTAGGGASLSPAGAGTVRVESRSGAEVSKYLDAQSLRVDAGAPGTYSPAVTAAERPRNVTELTERAQPNGRAPWDAGQYVPVGSSGKRAHWTGDRWAGGESPGYAPADTQFPGDGDDTAEDLSR